MYHWSFLLKYGRKLWTVLSTHAVLLWVWYLMLFLEPFVYVFIVASRILFGHRHHDAAQYRWSFGNTFPALIGHHSLLGNLLRPLPKIQQ